MYEAHFGLQGRPFDTGIAHDVDVFRGGRQTTVIDKAKLALAARDSVVTFQSLQQQRESTLERSTWSITTSRVYRILCNSSMSSTSSNSV